MNKKGKEPLLLLRSMNFLLGVMSLVLLLLAFLKVEGKEVFEIMVFALAAIENFVGATISFSEQKKVRGTIYSVVSAVFVITAAILAFRYFIVL